MHSNWACPVIKVSTLETGRLRALAWTAVADKLGKLDLTGAKAVPIDLDHKDWDTEILELDPSPPRDSPDKSGSPPLKSRRQALAEKQVASPDSSTGSWQKISWSLGLPETTSQRVSLRVVSASKVNRSTGFMNIHLLNQDGKAVGRWVVAGNLQRQKLLTLTRKTTGTNPTNMPNVPGVSSHMTFLQTGEAQPKLNQPAPQIRTQTL